MKALTASHILVNGHWRQDTILLLSAGKIARLIAQDDLPAGIPLTDKGAGFLAPGYFDSQVNGGGGVLLNDQPTLAGLQTVAEAHRPYGTTSFLPTFITDHFDGMQRMAEAVCEARARGLSAVRGVHFEGPYLNRDRKGVHQSRHIRGFEEKFIDLITTNDLGAVLVTLAPEAVGTDMIEALRKAGAVVSAGHTNASYEQTVAAIEAGLTGFTHLYNAMPPMLSRDPGVVGAALGASDAYCGVIADGYHVHPAVLKNTLAAKSPDRMMLVTDAMPPVGTDATSFMLQGSEILVKDGRCTTDDGTLAGSALTMESAVQNSLAWFGLPLEDALKMASETPARFMGLEADIGLIAPNRAADFVLLSENGAVQEVLTAV